MKYTTTSVTWPTLTRVSFSWLISGPRTKGGRSTSFTSPIRLRLIHLRFGSMEVMQIFVSSISRSILGLPYKLFCFKHFTLENGSRQPWWLILFTSSSKNRPTWNSCRMSTGTSCPWWILMVTFFIIYGFFLIEKDKNYFGNNRLWILTCEESIMAKNSFPNGIRLAQMSRSWC